MQTKQLLPRSTSTVNLRGFTLIELLVASTVMILLMGAVLVSYSSSLKRGRDAKRTSDMSTVRAAMELYRIANNGTYPGTGDAVAPTGIGLPDANTHFNNMLTTLFTGGFISRSTLLDPKTGTALYDYVYFPNPVSAGVYHAYEICADYEVRPSDCVAPVLGSPTFNAYPNYCCYTQP